MASKYTTNNGFRWMGDLSVYSERKDKVIRKRKKGFKTKKASKAWESSNHLKIIEGRDIAPKNIDRTVKVQKVWQNFIDNKKNLNLKFSTVVGYQSIYANHFSELFQNSSISTVDISVERIIEDVLQKDITAKTKNNILGLLKSFCNYLNKKGYLSNISFDFPKIKSDDPGFRYLSSEEIEAVKTELKSTDKKYYLMFILAIKTGLRMGELFALRWKDINFQKNLLTVNINYVMKKITTPKGRRSRTIPISNFTIEELKKHQHDREFIFSKPNGDFLSKSMADKVLRRSSVTANVKPFGWHVLRHTFASILACNGTSMAVIQKLLGHRDIKTTLKYAHLSPKTKRKAIGVLDNY
ncbi:MAG: site-specific integrase [Deltaproteobacteria bacterium]|nr:site-specific integrase [Deltaproteobacteria bacterium]